MQIGKYFMCFFLFAIFLSFSSLAEVDIQSVEKMNLSLNLSFALQPVKKAEKIIPLINAKIYLFPYKTPSQASKITSTFPNATILGNDNMLFFNYQLHKAEVKTYKFGYSALITTKKYMPHITNIIPFPYNFSRNNITKYLLPTPLFDFDKSELAYKAHSLVRDEKDYLKAIFKIAEWVEENVIYVSNNETEENQLSASWVYTHRIGVCDEFSILLAAMLRSVGIPARVVSGFAYSSSNLAGLKDWGPHAWTEAYVPKYGWIPIDPTFDEFLWLDAGHILLQYSEKYNAPSFKYSWKSRATSFDSTPINFTIHVLSYEEGKPLNLSYELNSLRPSMDPSSYNGINIVVKNTQPFYVPLLLRIGMPKEVVFDGDKKIFVLLPPKTVFNKTILFKVNKYPPPNSIYTFPFSLYVNGHLAALTNVKVAQAFPHYAKKDFDKLSIIHNDVIKLDCFPESHRAIIRDYLKIKCFVYNKASFPIKDILCLEDRCKPFNLSKANSSSFVFYYLPYKTGRYTLKASIKGFNKASSIQFQVYDRPNISITKENFSEIKSPFGSSQLTIRVSPQTFSPIYNFSLRLFLDDLLLKEWHEANLTTPIVYGALIKNYLFKAGSNIRVFVRYYDLNGNPYSQRKNFPVEVDSFSLLGKIYAVVMQQLFAAQHFLYLIQDAYESLFKHPFFKLKVASLKF